MDPTYFMLPYIYLYSNQTTWNQLCIEHLLCFRHGDENFNILYHLILITWWYYFAHFTNEETETLKISGKLSKVLWLVSSTEKI